MTGTKWREISALAVSTVLSTLGGAKFLSLPPTPASIIVISKIRNKNNYKHDRSIDSIADEIYVFFIYLKINRKEKYTAYFSKDAFNYTHNFNCERNSFENEKKKKGDGKSFLRSLSITITILVSTKDLTLTFERTKGLDSN